MREFHDIDVEAEMGTARLSNNITGSSLVLKESIVTRYLFLMLLSQTDRSGIVEMSPSEMARQFNMKVEDVHEGLHVLMGKDPDSRTPNNEGRRIACIDAYGHRWQIHNVGIYLKEYVRTHDAERKREQRMQGNGRSRDAIEIPYEEIRQLWNNTVTQLKPVKVLSDERKKRIRQRWLQQEINTLNKWRRFFEKVAASDFLCGRAISYSPHRTWRAHFDWCLKKENCIKIYEGTYDNE